LLNALLSTNQEVDPTLAGLETIGLSVHLIPLLASCPEQLALAIARRLPALQRATFIAPGKNPRREIPVLELVGPKDGSRVNDFRTDAMTWEFQRSQDICTDIRDKEATYFGGPQLPAIQMAH
jgi:hypothetical protein